MRLPLKKNIEKSRIGVAVTGVSREYCSTVFTSSSSGGLSSLKGLHMFSEIITTLSEAFESVVKLFTDVLGQGFGAIGDLSSNLFGGEATDGEGA